MNKIILNAKPLTKETFKSFGDVIEMEGAEHFPINAGTVERYNDLADVQIDFEDGGRPVISFMQITQDTQLPCRLNVIERHPKGSQAFIPTFEAPIVLVVGPKGDLIFPETLQAFVTNGKQGFNFHAGTWHMPLMSDVKDRICIIVDRAGPGDNCDEVYLKDDHIELTVN